MHSKKPSLAACLSLLLFCVGSSIAAEKPPLVVAGDFVPIYDPTVGEKEKWYINDHCLISGSDGLWHLFGITLAKYFLFIGPRPGYDGTDVFVSSDPFHWKIGDKAGHIPAHAAEVIRDTDGKWYVSRCGWGRGGVYLAPLTWQDGQDNPDTNIPVPKTF